MSTAQAWAGVILPTATVTSVWWFWVRHICTKWRGELCDSKIGIYPPATVDEMAYCRHPVEDPAEALRSLAPEESLGTVVRPDVFSIDERRMLLAELPAMMRVYGRKLTRDYKAFLASTLSDAGLDTEWLDDVRFISDAYEDPREPRGAWGTGDALAFDKLPPLLREASSRIQQEFPMVGRLRHVWVEYSPKGKFYRPARQIHQFFGHEYVFVPISTNNRGMTLTLSPTNRSRFADLNEVLRLSWSTRDLDVYVPSGGIARIIGTARFRHNWSLRPKWYFGHPTNPLPLGDDFRSITHSQARSVALNASIVTAVARAVAAMWRTWLVALVALLPDALVAPVKPLLAERAQASSDAASIDDDDQEGAPEAYAIFHYEGPVSMKDLRNRLRRWEMYAYGEAPGKDSYNWDANEKPPTEEAIGKWYEVPWWMLRHYFHFGRYG